MHLTGSLGEMRQFRDSLGALLALLARRMANVGVIGWCKLSR